jgi:uncharacterized protein
MAELQLDRGSEVFDIAVLAVHSDTARQLRGQDATAVEAAILDAIPYASNKVYLHTGVDCHLLYSDISDN